MEKEDEWEEWFSIHSQMPYVHQLPVDTKVKNWINSTYRYSSWTNSTQNEPVIHTEENPFIIGRIEKVGNNEWRYERQKWDVRFDNFASTGKQSITVDKHLPYQVGDTLRLYCRLLNVRSWTGLTDEINK